MYSKEIIFIVIILSIILNTACSNNKIEAYEIAETAKTSNEIVKQCEPNKETEIDLEADRIIALDNNDYNLNLIFSDEQLRNLKKSELSILRNAIYAKYGYEFSTQKYIDFFKEYAWYSGKSKDIEYMLEDIDYQNIDLILEYESLANQNFESSIKNEMESKNQEVEVRVEEIETTEDSNYPKRVYLKNNAKEIVFSSYWNDGITIGFADFNTNDEYKDVYITELGTDVSFDTYIYRYNGDELFEYAKFTHYIQEFLFNNSGDIYFLSEPEHEIKINSSFNYMTKEIMDINERLKYRVNNFK